MRRLHTSVRPATCLRPCRVRFQCHMAVSIDSNATWCPCFVVELYGEWAATVTFAMDKTTEQIKGPPKGIDITNGKGFPGFDAQPALHAHTEDWERKVRDINSQVARCQAEGADFTDVDNRWWATWATSEKADIDAAAEKTHPVRSLGEKKILRSRERLRPHQRFKSSAGKPTCPTTRID